MAYGVSNGHVTDDVMWPRKVLWDSTVGYPSDSLASCIYGDIHTVQSLAVWGQPVCQLAWKSVCLVTVCLYEVCWPTSSRHTFIIPWTGESLPLQNSWRRWTQNTSDRWVGAVWPVDHWRRYQPVLSSSKRLCLCMWGTIRGLIDTMKRTVTQTYK